MSEITTYRLFVNDNGTLLVRMWSDGIVEVSTRTDRDAVWGPPTYLTEELVHA